MAWKREGCPPFEKPPEKGWAPLTFGRGVDGGASTTGEQQQQPSRVAGAKRRRGGAGGGAKLTFAAMIAEPQVSKCEQQVWRCGVSRPSHCAMISTREHFPHALAIQDQMAGLTATERKIMPTLQVSRSYS